MGDNLNNIMTKLFEDKNGDGVPDAFEGISKKNGNATVITKNNIEVNGKTYDNIDEIPPALRDQLKGVFKILSDNKLMSKALDLVGDAKVDVKNVKLDAEKVNLDTITEKRKFSVKIGDKWVFALLLVVIFYLLWRFL